jgi:hypothetical protein
MPGNRAPATAHLDLASLRLAAVTIRPARDSDVAALERLAERDTRLLPGGPLLVAERDGTIQAALALHSGRSIADPFTPTAELVTLLRTHAEARQARSSHPPGRLAFRLAGGSA